MKQGNHETQSKLQKIATAVTLVLTLGGVAISLFNFIILNQLQPINFRVSAVERDRATLATKEQVDAISDKVDELSTYVHTLIEKGLK